MSVEFRVLTSANGRFDSVARVVGYEHTKREIPLFDEHAIHDVLDSYFSSDDYSLYVSDLKLRNHLQEKVHTLRQADPAGVSKADVEHGLTADDMKLLATDRPTVYIVGDSAAITKDQEVKNGDWLGNDGIINKFEDLNPDNWPAYFVENFSGKHLYTVTSLRALRPPVMGHSDGPLSKHAEAVAMMRVHYTMKKFTEKDVRDWLKKGNEYASFAPGGLTLIPKNFLHWLASDKVAVSMFDPDPKHLHFFESIAALFHRGSKEKRYKRIFTIKHWSKLTDEQRANVIYGILPESIDRLLQQLKMRD